MNELVPFNFEGKKVRVFAKDNEPWFVAKDVCNVLGLGNPSEALRNLDDDERMTLRIPEGHSGVRGGARSINIISESGLYALIMRSNKPRAKVFRKWVTSEVLPAIRKTGSYTATPGKGTPVEPERYISLLTYTNNLQKTMIALLHEQNRELNAKVARLTRPPLTEDEKEMIRIFGKDGTQTAQIAVYIGCSKSTVRKYKR